MSAIESLCLSEGYTEVRLPPTPLKGDSFLNASLFLFGFIVPDKDVRWALIAQFVNSMKQERWKPIHYETSMQAKYLSSDSSHRANFTKYRNESQIRQLCRALQNLGMYGQMGQLFEETSQPLPEGVGLDFVRTSRVCLGTGPDGTTGCPEALYQVRMFVNGEYSARAGFNVHSENGQRVMSITNIQGTPGKSELYDDLQQRLGASPFNFLVRRCVEMAQHAVEPLIVRGLKNPKNMGSRPLYNAVFKKEGVTRVSFKK